MKRITFSKTIVWAVTLMMSWSGFSQNLLNNGDFELGFNIGHQGGQAPNYTVLTTPYSGTTAAGNWTIFTNPQPVNTTSFITSGDHTTGSGQMMIIDGTNVGGQQRFWKAGNNGGGVCGLTVGVTYTFSYWIRSIFTTAGGTLANIGVQFNNANNVTLVSGSATAPTVANGWRQVVYTFTPTNACVNIELYNNNTDFAGNDFAIDDFSLTAPACPPPTVSVTQQPTCAVPTGTIVFTNPVGPSPLPIPTDLFISEVTDESSGALSYIEIFNGTGTPKNLANYKLKIYNNGNPGPSNFCDFALSGTLNNNDVYVVGVGSATNQGGVVPDLVVSACPGFNTNDNVRLATSADVEFDLWGRTDGVDFTPLNQSGYTYRRLDTAPHPSMTWNPADWTAIDPQDYRNWILHLPSCLLRIQCEWYKLSNESNLHRLSSRYL